MTQKRNELLSFIIIELCLNFKALKQKGLSFRLTLLSIQLQLIGKQVLHVSLLENQLQIPILSPKTPFLDEALGKRLSWHPFNNPSLLLRETVSCREFLGRGLCRLGSPPSPTKIANTWSSCSTLFTSELKTTATYCSQEVFPW